MSPHYRALPLPLTLSLAYPNRAEYTLDYTVPYPYPCPYPYPKPWP